MKLEISHVTVYSFESNDNFVLQQLRQTPKNRSALTTLSWHIETEGAQIHLEYEDHNNNRVTLLGMDEGCHDLKVTARGIVETLDNSGITGRHGGFAPLWYFNRHTDYTKPGPLIREMASQLRSDKGDNDIAFLHGMSAHIIERVKYQTGTTNVATTAEQALDHGAGVCQDHTHLMTSLARQFGYPARYVSGYLMLNDRVDQEASHAWAEVYVEGPGWIGFDVSNQISPDERYVPLATGLDYNETAPVSGVRIGKGSETMLVNLQVQQ